MNFEDWETGVPSAITQDSLWRLEAYRLGVFVADIGWHDATKLLGDKRTRGLSDQLYRALGSISANLAEGYSRGTGRDRARFYEYALGSARESRDWYYKGRNVLGEAVAEHRIDLLTQIIRLLLKMVPQQRGRILRERGDSYGMHVDENGLYASPPDLGFLLDNVPLSESYRRSARGQYHVSRITLSDKE